MLENIGNTITRLAMDLLGQNLAATWHVRQNGWQRLLLSNEPSNGALDIQQLASGGRTREPILMKFGIQQQLRTTVTVMWSNIKSWRTVVVGKYSKCHNSPAMDRLGRNFDGRIPSYSKYWKCYNSSYDGTDWDDSWVVASKQHLCCKTVSLVFRRYC